tara:strand:+ start:356 stop:643 length:288 start_codon:yes stop_codon:yes gene_type:complete
MVNKSKILSDISKMAIDAMSTFADLRKELEVLVSLRVNKILNKMNLVKRDEFEILKKIVQNLTLEIQKTNKTNKIKEKKTKIYKKNTKNKKKLSK